MQASIILPAYNEGAHIQSVLLELLQHLREHHGNVEVLVVDDGSDLLDVIFKACTDEADLVIGQRMGYTSPWIRRPGKRLLAWVAEYLTEAKIPDLNSGLRAFRRERFLAYAHLFPNGFSLSTTSTVCFLKEKLNVVFVPIRIQPRKGKSTVRASDGGKTFMLIFRLIMLFSPLRIFLPTSILCGLIALAVLIQDIFIDRNISDSALVMLSLTGLLFFFGLLADQVAAVRREINRQ